MEAFWLQIVFVLHVFGLLIVCVLFLQTKLLPEGHSDMVSSNKDQVLAKLDFLMAGRAAENMIFGKDNVMKGLSCLHT